MGSRKVIILDAGYKFIWKKDELDTVKKLWLEGYLPTEIASMIKESVENTWLAINHLYLRGRLALTDKLVIPLPLITLNQYINAERSNRFKASKIKKEMTEICRVHALIAKNSGLVIQTPFKAIFKWHVKNKRHDLDNIAFQKKFILDGMIKAELIENDGYNQHRQSEDIYLIDADERVEIEFLEVTS